MPLQFDGELKRNGIQMVSIISAVLGTTRNTGSTWLARKTRRDCKQTCVAMFPKMDFHSALVFFCTILALYFVVK